MKNDVKSMLREFQPALRFVSFFVGVYISGNVLYGLYVALFSPGPDPATTWVTFQSAFLLTTFSEPVQAIARMSEPIVLITKQGKTILRVYEGCNGLNVMIVFISFVIAFDSGRKRILVFLLAGCVVVHVANLGRIMLLFYTALYRPSFFYYFHKYLFTAILYLVVIALWFIWIESDRRKSKNISHVTE